MAELAMSGRGASARGDVRRWAAGLAIAAATLAAPVAAQAHWSKAESAHFIVYSSGGERDLRDYTTKLEDFDDLLRTFHNVKADDAPEVKLEVVLVNSSAALRVMYPEASEGTAGFYDAGIHKILAASNYSAMSGDYVLFHEYAHHFMRQHFPYGYPAWLTEGYAEYFAPTEMAPTIIDVGRFSPERATWLFAQEWVPMKELLTRQDWSMALDRRMMFYVQSWLLTHYMMATPEHRRQLDVYTRAVGAGQDSVSAMEKATGMTAEELQRTLRNYHRIPYLHLTRPKRQAADLKVSGLPDSADDLLLLDLRDSAGLSETDRPAYLKAVRRAAAKHPGDDYAQIVLAQAETRYGDTAAAEAILKSRLTAHPDEARALRLSAERRLRDGDADPANREKLYKEARLLLVQAYKAAPSDYEALFYYAQSRAIDPDDSHDNTLKALMESHALAPQVADISMALAQTLIRKQRYGEAEKLLTPIANDPHGGESAKAAKALLAQLLIRRPGDASGSGAPATR